MTITDGMILFAACVVSFVIGYSVGAIKVARFVNHKLTQIQNQLTQHGEELQQFYSKVEETEK
jgi:uncharacterized membrane-anchored protein YhcB (DUF1043 family)